MLSLRLLARALRWRAASSFAIFIVAVVAVLAAVIGPIYLAAASQTVLTERLRQAPRGELDVRITRDTLPATTPFQLAAGIRSVGAVASKTPWFGTTVVAESAQVAFSDKRHIHVQARMGTVDGFCAHLHFTAGNCPTALGQTAISARSATEGRFSLGDVIKSRTVKEDAELTLKITGIYQPVDEHGRYWSAWTFFDQQPALFLGQIPTLDTLFVASSAMPEYSLKIAVSTIGITPLLPDTVAVSDEADVRRAAAATAAAATEISRGQRDPTKANSPVGTRLDVIDHELSLTRTLVNLATLQLALLVICVLYALVSATATAHGNEVALAKLRGRRWPAVLSQGLLEPIVLVVLAAPVGAVLAWLTVREVAPHTLGSLAEVTFPRSALLITVLTAGAAVVAAGLAARRIVIAPVGALLRRGNETETSRIWLFVADAAVLAIALAGLYQLSAGGVLTAGKPNPLSALAPTLLAVAVAVVGLRLLPFGARAVLAATRESRRLVPFLAVRQILRRANSTRLAVLLAVAIALATLAVSTWSVGGTNRDIRALNQAGAARVLKVTAPDGEDLKDVVDRADPSGKYAMAVELLPVNNTQLLAVQTRRMDGIAAWRGDYAPVQLSKIVRILNPHLPPSLMVYGKIVRVDLTVTKLTPGVPLTASVRVSQPSHLALPVDLGSLQMGRHTYTADLPSGCVQGCRVAEFALGTRGAYQPPLDFRNPQYHPEAHVTLASIQGEGPGGGPAESAYFGDHGHWRASGSGDVLITDDDGGLELDAQPDDGTTNWPVIVPNDVPDHVPAVVAKETASVYPGERIHDISVLGLDGNSVPVDGKVISAALPQLGLSGTIADLDLVQRAMAGPEIAGVQHQVWLSPHAPAEVEQRLQRAGLHIVGTDTQEARRAALDRSGPAYADLVFLLAALAASVLAIGGAVLAAVVTARRRSYELAALEAVGVRPRTLRWASAAEQGVLIGLGVLFGVVAGIGGSAMALPSTPVFVHPHDGPPLEYALPWSRLLILIAAVVVVLAAVCLLVARAIEGHATAARLRETL